MSDAFTDIYRDDKINNARDEINELEKKFESTPSKDLSEKIISKLNKLKGMRRGYWESVSVSEVEERISYYENYLENQQ